MDSEKQSGFQPWVIVAIFALAMMFAGELFKTPINTNNDVSTTVSIVDTMFDKENADSEYYKASIISCKDSEDFVIRKIVNDNGNGDFEVIAQMKSGDYKVLTVDDDNIDMYVLGNKSDTPYTLIKFANSSGSTITKLEVYLPYKYSIETSNKSESISYDCGIVEDKT